ncbi:DUF4230 domain-containing protein [Gudongella sp. DL1XJH-153]|uniref:DUF4230 domain-containing protein n=1 Tax=Gudongella sp. DL1XJH-153 TaxID=3409804 RepID=UPI003BB65404
MKKLIRIMILIFIVFTVVVAGFILMNDNKLFQSRTNISSETALVQDRLVELSEWATLRYEYSNVIVSRTERTLSLGVTDINYGEAIRLIEYSGYLKAGTDLSKIQMTYNEQSERMFVRVPKSKILDNVVDTDSARVEDVKGNIFSDYPTQIIFDEINADKKELEDEKISQGFLEEADNRLHQLLTSFLATNGYNDVVVEFH